MSDTCEWIGGKVRPMPGSRPQQPPASNSHPRRFRRWAEATAINLVLEIAASQHGMVTRAQLLISGFSPSQVDWAQRSSRLFPVYQGVYAVGRPISSDRQFWMAGVLAAGSQAVLARNSAARLLGFSTRGRQVDVIRLESRKGRNVRLDSANSPNARRLQVRRTRNMPEHHLTIVEGIRVTTAERTLTDLAGDLSERQLTHRFLEADRVGLLDDGRLARMLRDRSGCGGIELVRRLADERDPRVAQTRSLLEALLLKGVTEGRLPMPEINKWIGPYCVDFYWERSGVVVEADGQSFHSGTARMTRDIERENYLKRRGLEVLRFTWREVDENRYRVIHQIENAVLDQ